MSTGKRVRDDEGSKPPLGSHCMEAEPRVPAGNAKGASEIKITLMSPHGEQSPHLPFSKCVPFPCSQMGVSSLNRTPGISKSIHKSMLLVLGSDHEAR